MQEQIKQQMMQARKAGDKRRYEAAKLLVSALSYAKIAKGADLTDEEVIALLKKEAKKRKESVEAYARAGSQERVDQEKYELEMIEEYLPQEMGEEELRTKVAEIAGRSGKTGGQLIGEVMRELGGNVDGGMVARIVATM